jgi:phosphatidylglycerophosphatase A
LIALGFGSGLSPRAPGTMGTLVAVLLYPLFTFLSPASYFFLWFLLCLGAIYISGNAERKIGIHDDSRIVCDEMVGFWLATWMLPSGIWWLFTTFVLFRLFDIFKPWPIYLLQKLPRGYGCVLDDVGAGFVTFLLIQLCFFVSNL